jgi:hypothetical protein
MPVRLRPLGLLEQLRVLLQESGWNVRLSDKGVYATESASIFGDIAQLANVAGDENWHALFGLLTERKNRPPGHFSRSDQRRYFVLDEIAAAIEQSRLTLTPTDLISTGVIWRGLRSRCPRCRWESWYPQDELAAKVRCSRCRLEVSARDTHWVGTAEPTWWYRIHEVLWQFVTTHADLALNASFKFLTSEQSPATVLPAIELLNPDGRAAIEIDLAVLGQRRLWLGEAKATSSLGSATEARAQLNKLRRAVGLLGADGILMVSGAPSGFSADTRTLIHERLDDLGAERVIEAI